MFYRSHLIRVHRYLLFYDGRKVVRLSHITGLANHCWIFARTSEDRSKSDKARRRIEGTDDSDLGGSINLPTYSKVYKWQRVLPRLQGVLQDPGTTEASLWDAILLLRDLFEGHQVTPTPGLLKDVMLAVWSVMRVEDMQYTFLCTGWSHLLE